MVVDADLLFMGTGPLPSPVVIHVEDGAMVGVEGDEAGRLEEMLARCDDERMANLAEVSMAFNPSGRVCGVAMETESALGTAHIALGNSIAYGGTVDAVAHLDCVMKDATLELDGRPVMVGRGAACEPAARAAGEARARRARPRRSRSSRWRCATPAPRSSTSGMRRSVDEIVQAAIDDDVDVIGISVLSGAHLPLVRELVARARRARPGRAGRPRRHHPRRRRGDAPRAWA